MLHLHVFLWLRNLHTFYSLLIFLKTCEHFLVGSPIHLSNWQMKYSRMTWLLLFHSKVLEIYFTNQNSNSMFLEWHSNTYQGHIWSYIIKPFIYASLCWVWSSFVTPLRDVSCSQDQNSRTHHKIYSYSYKGNTLQHAFFIHKINTPCFTNTICLAYSQKETTRLCKKKF